jgi:nitroimidazol reductase NimA-like FMN-containing flavoprotein (pyridoxamine 5'-phosphate oxidase superfamily)
MTDDPRTTVRRHPERGTEDRTVIDAILDEAMVCHVGFVDAGGGPVVIPMLHARNGNRILLHGSPASRLIRTLKAGGDVCVTVTIVDGVVLARSVFNHAMNYRSVVLFGTAEEVTDPGEKDAALRAFTERLLPGRWEEARRPTDRETRATTILAIPIDRATAKVRTGPPSDDEADLSLEVWAGVVPIRSTAGTPEPDPPDGNRPIPPSVRSLL